MTLHLLLTSQMKECVYFRAKKMCEIEGYVDEGCEERSTKL